MVEEKEKRFERRDRRGIFDKLLERVTSRKLLAFCTATYLLLVGDLTSDWWGFVCVAYIGSQSAVDLIAKLKNE